MSAPVDHPPPWEWLGRPDEETALLDGEGYSILSPSNDSGISIRSPYVREVVRAAPEMETLLRDLSASQSIVMDGETEEQRRHRLDGLRRAIIGAGPIVQRLDEARKAGG